MWCVTLIGRGKRLPRKVLKALKSDCSLRGESDAEKRFCATGRCMLYRVDLYTLIDPVCVAFFLLLHSIYTSCVGADAVIIPSLFHIWPYMFICHLHRLFMPQVLQLQHTNIDCCEEHLTRCIKGTLFIFGLPSLQTHWVTSRSRKLDLFTGAQTRL